MKFEDAFTDFLEDQKAAGYAPNTMRHFEQTTSVFKEYLDLKKLFDIGDVSPRDVKAFYAWCWERSMERSYNSSAIQYARRFSQNVRKFFKWAVKAGHVLVDPSHQVNIPKVPQRLPRDILTIPEVNRLLAAPDTNTPVGIRDRAILELMYSTGMRRAELMKLKLGDVDMKQKRIMIIEGKRRKDRVVPFGTTALKWLKKYLDDSRPLLERDSALQNFFITFRGEPFNPYTMDGMIERSREQAGLAKRISAHTLRHTCATHMVQAGADIRYVQKLLGHEDINTTQIYTRVAVKDLAEHHAKFHPRTKLTPEGQKSTIDGDGKRATDRNTKRR